VPCTLYERVIIWEIYVVLSPLSAINTMYYICLLFIFPFVYVLCFVVVDGCSNGL
jgi:hypothetical protein